MACLLNDLQLLIAFLGSLPDRVTFIVRRLPDPPFHSAPWRPGNVSATLFVSHQRYFVRCTKEYVDAMASECTKSPGAREVTVIQMSFAKSEIWIALPGDGATFLEAN